MGSWQLEVGRMTLYIFFPIGMYYYLNRTDDIEEWITNKKKKYDMLDDKRQLELKRVIEDFSHKQRMKHHTELEAEYLESKMM